MICSRRRLRPLYYFVLPLPLLGFCFSLFTAYIFNYDKVRIYINLNLFISIYIKTEYVVPLVQEQPLINGLRGS
jgi:hypothetical protein